jgi:hypothetical protein
VRDPSIDKEEIAMKRISILVVTFVLLSASNAMASAEELALRLVGVWRVKSFEGVDVQSKEAYKPFGENPYYVFTKGGRYLKGNSSGTYKVEGPRLSLLTTDQQMTAYRRPR